MELNTLKKIYSSKGLNDERIQSWVINNIRQYVYYKNYPPKLSPTGKWDKDAFLTLFSDFITGKTVKDRKTNNSKTIIYFNPIEIFDRSENIKNANALLQLQVHFFFQKNKESSIKHNLIRRISEICSEDKILCKWGKGKNLILGLNIWQMSDPGYWNGSDDELYHESYSTLGEYIAKIYGVNSEYNSPEIGDKDLRTFLLNLLSSINKKLKISQVLFVLGYKLGIEDIRIESLDDTKERESKASRVVNSEAINPSEDLEYSELCDLVCANLNPELLALLDFLLQNPNVSIEVYAGMTHRASSTVYYQAQQIRSILSSYVNTAYEQRMLLNKLLEKRLPLAK